MQFGKYVSLKEIIEGVYINTGIQNIDFTESLFHSVRMLGKLGVPQVYQTKITDGGTGNLSPIEITNYKGDLPFDMVGAPQGIRDYDTKMSFTYSTDIFFQDPGGTTTGVIFEPTYPETDYTEFQAITVDQIGSDEFVNQRFLFFKDQFESEVNRNLEIHALNSNIGRTNVMRTYTIDGNQIITNIKQCKLEMVYNAIYTDKDGYPMIPDDEIIKEAMEKYLQERIDYKLWRVGKITNDVYKDTQQKYHWAMAQARSHGCTPTIDQMQSIANTWLRLIPDLRSHKSGFKFNSEQERIWYK